MEITVYTAKFHGGEIIYRGKSLNQAIRAARKDTCSKRDSDCRCGGAEIIVEEDGARYRLHEWKATPPFHSATQIVWESI